jgi:MFS superfamily sulfate permease-like transporter
LIHVKKRQPEHYDFGRSGSAPQFARMAAPPSFHTTVHHKAAIFEVLLCFSQDFPARFGVGPMGRGKRFGHDLSASLIVFLVALPLCLGIAIASGVPPARGIVTGIIGGILAGRLAGAPLSVSGPAAGLTTLVFELVSNHGLAALGPIILLAGALQVVAGVARIGGYVRSMPPAIVEGMLAAIGLILVASQFHVMLDAAPRAGFLPNLQHLQPIIVGGNFVAAGLGMLTIATTLGWERFRPRPLREVPGALLGVFCATTAVALFGLRVAHVALPPSLADAVALVHPAQLMELTNPAILGAAVSVALIASIESLLSAAAIDRMTPRRHTDYSRELVAQGVGNMACGVVGALPMTGVIVRSAANVRAGARTRNSAVMHGVWLLALVALAPGLLELIPTSSLAGLLVLVGVRLVNVGHVRALAGEGWASLGVYGTTVGVILCTNLLTGVLAGLAMFGAIWAVPKLVRKAV